MKKLRGKKRYYRKLLARATDYNLRLTEKSWFDMWHTHLDWSGIGNMGMRPRRQHISALVHLHNNLLKQLESFSKPYQIWITIHKKDSGQDAVFIHTPNENRDNFPFKFDHLAWDCPVPQILEGIFNASEYDLGSYGSVGNDEIVYFLCLKNRGTSVREDS
ncbi:hypothetical protein J31TS6_22940 [Brevibacillus reuszeri]|uniref:hypothetical protein n=1 Tax=Brevibacillus reuszeri TaxID=54915 RepID=UPI001B1945F5|nr:hypothetical protein [Brevibacillus reuszeri]GIO06266.1 hypothetical protein J31TS6_22940 [Brevibacillus reuszeri]